MASARPRHHSQIDFAGMGIGAHRSANVDRIAIDKVIPSARLNVTAIIQSPPGS